MFNRILEIIDQFNIKEHRHFKNKINNYILIGLVCSLLIMFVYLMIRFHDNHNINYIDNMKKKLDTKYENVHPYKGIIRNITYLGGVYSNDDNNWHSIYYDNDTKEILNGGENDNYLYTDIPKSGKDLMIVPSKRQTEKGFQEYVLNWVGAIEYNDSIGHYSKNYGIEYKGYNYEYPIDYLADANWNYNTSYSKYNISKISTISQIGSNNYNYLVKSLNTKEYILNILRNCFGFVSDDFYDFVNNKNNFLEIFPNAYSNSDIIPNEINIGDIGTYVDKKGLTKIGICVGFDNKFNPIFSICTNDDIFEFKNIKKIYKDMNGFNVLHIEYINTKNPFLKNRNVFKHFYKTSLPFVNNNNKNELIINNIDNYNRNFLYGVKSIIDEDKLNDLMNRVLQERLNRIMLREFNAEQKRIKYNITSLNELYSNNLYSYKDLNTVEYISYIYELEIKGPGKILQ